MEIVTVKSEVSPGRRRLCMVEGDIAATKCVKRRRRDPSAVVLCCNDQQSEQQLQQPQPPQVEQSNTTTTVKRSSRFRGVSRHRWTGRFEAHLWDKGSWNATQRKKGKQVYLGAYDEEESAARAYDLAAIKYWGASTFTNFPVSDYEKEIKIMQNVTKEEYLASLRRRSSGFSRGVSKYRGVARHHHNGRWEARIGRVFGNKYLYLGTYGTQEEAAHAYDIAAIEYRGINAVTNFDLSTYIRWLRPGGHYSVAYQEPRSIIESRLMPTSSNCISRDEPAELSFHYNPFKMDDLGTPQKQEIFQRKIPINPGNISSSSSTALGLLPISSSNKSSSAPTALGLLLRSSVFRELMVKNSNATDEEVEGTDTKNQPLIGSGDEFGRRIIYEEVGEVPYVHSSNGEALRTESAAPLYNRAGQSLWNSALSMPSSSIH